MYELNEEVVTIVINRRDAHFDRACESAAHQAIGVFDVDEDGYINGVHDSERGRDSIEIDFVSFDLSMSMGGWSYTYTFTAKIISNEEEA